MHSGPVLTIDTRALPPRWRLVQLDLADIGEDPPIAHPDDPFGMMSDFVLVSDHHDGATAGGKLVEQRQHVRGAMAIERPSGLIGQ